mgnify:CR=1 FL=1
MSEAIPLGFVYHGKYLEYFEQSRTDLLRGLGLPYSKIEAMGIFIVVLEAHLQYKRSARYDDVLIVKAMVKEMPGVKFRIEYEAMREGETEIMVEGYTTHGFLNAHTGKPTRPPKEFLDVMLKQLQ